MEMRILGCAKVFKTISMGALLSLLLSVLVWAGPEVQVEGLFKGGAILRIDGQQKMLREGKRHAGVEVIEATTQYVLVDINGQRQKLTMSRHIMGGGSEPETLEVKISKDSYNRYLTYATINGRRITVLVDTGANIVAMSSKDAKALGIAYLKGRKSRVVTASGNALAYSLILKSVTVGGITVSGVRASVVEGDFPETVLLGMTYLSHVDMQESNGIMTLRRKY